MERNRYKLKKEQNGNKKQLLLSNQLYLSLLLMISFSSSQEEIDCGNAALRRSDRKRTKKIFKEDLLHKSTHKPHQRTEKKHKTLFINQNIPSQMPLYPQQQTHQPTNLFPSKTFHTNLQALREMRQAVNRQQIKYGELMETKISLQVSKGKQTQEKCISQGFREGESCRQQKEEMVMGEYDMERGSEMSYDSCEVELVRMVTGCEDMHLQFQCMRLGSDFHSDGDHDYSTFDDVQCHDLFLSEIVPCRKESAIMLSDDYQSNELTYTMEQLQPRWLREENIQHVDW